MSEGRTGIGAKAPTDAVGVIDEIGIGMLGYAFMGKAHSNAFRKIQYMTWPPPLMPRLVAIAGRTSRPLQAQPSATGTSAGRPTGGTSSPILRSACSTTVARIRCMPSRRSPRPRPASTSSARSRSVVTPTRLRHLAAGGRDRRQASLRVQLPVRPSRAPCSRDDRRRRARRDPSLPRPLSPGLGRRPDTDTWRFDAAAAGSERWVTSVRT